jgi:hypothetical protein
VWLDLASAPLQHLPHPAPSACSLRVPSPAALAGLIANCGRCIVVASPDVFVRYQPQSSSSSAAAAAAEAEADGARGDDVPVAGLSIVPSFFRRSWCVNLKRTLSLPPPPPSPSS